MTLVLVTRNRIPEHIYESWNTQPIVAGSDSECDSDEDHLPSETGSIGNLDISRTASGNPELAGSLLELDLSDSDEPVSIRAGRLRNDLKGKGRMRSVGMGNPGPAAAGRST